MGAARLVAFRMPNETSSDPVADLECAILRAICAKVTAQDVWTETQLNLAHYVWRQPDHAVIYDAIVKVRSRDPMNWRSQLPAQTTRMGFPDLDWAAYLAPVEMPEGRISELIRTLKALAERGT